MDSIRKYFFVSYNKADENWAEWIAWFWRENDYRYSHQAFAKTAIPRRKQITAESATNISWP